MNESNIELTHRFINWTGFDKLIRLILVIFTLYKSYIRMHDSLKKNPTFGGMHNLYISRLKKNPMIN